MDRFFASRVDRIEGVISCKDEIAHITKTLRMKIGDKIEVIDGKGKAYSGEIYSIQKEEILLRINAELQNDGELSTEITVYQGIPKSQKMDLIVQKLTEIGVSRIVPVKMERCVKQIGEKEDKLLARWERIAFEAVKQSKRTRLPKIEHPLTLKQLMEEIRKNPRILLCHENENKKALKQVLQDDSWRSAKRVGIIVGPEGGITEQEKGEMVEAGAISVSIAKSILRAETAAIVGATILAYELE